MKIDSAKTIMVTKWVEISIRHKSKFFKMSVKTEDDKVVGEARNGLYTSYLTYHNETTDKMKKRHFEQIKSYVEKYIK